MLINEVSKITGLTKKAIEYYIERGLISPSILENGYRNFTDSEVEQLNKISVLRKLGISTEDIKSLLDGEWREHLHNFAIKKELDIKIEQAKKSILEKLSSGIKLEEISKELQIIENSKTIIEKLLDAFPGYYGRFLCLHFERFLNDPIKTEEQKLAYEKVISFLDNAPSLNLPEDLKKYLSNNTKDIGTTQILDIIENTKNVIENPDEFLANNKEMIEQYLNYKQSDKYKNSLAYKIMVIIKEFNKTSGYNDIFIPALKKLSPSYNLYYEQLEKANEKLLSKF